MAQPVPIELVILSVSKDLFLYRRRLYNFHNLRQSFQEANPSMAHIWIVLLEVLAPIDHDQSKTKPGFINIVVSAEDADQAESRVRSVLSEYEWHILGIESVTQVRPEMSYQDDLNELIEQVAANPHFVLLSTLHTYKPN